MPDWTTLSAPAPYDRELPRNGELVMVRTPGGDERLLRRDGTLWFVPDGSMYVYFAPVAWRPLSVETDIPLLNRILDDLHGQERTLRDRIDRVERDKKALYGRYADERTGR